MLLTDFITTFKQNIKYPAITLSGFPTMPFVPDRKQSTKARPTRPRHYRVILDEINRH